MYLAASLPFGILYKLSDALYHLLKLSGYRRNVVVENLKNSFPNKTDAEIGSISSSYYGYLCDLILETMKTMNTSADESRKRCVFHNTEWLDKYFEAGQSLIIVMSGKGPDLASRFVRVIN